MRRTVPVVLVVFLCCALVGCACPGARELPSELKIGEEYMVVCKDIALLSYPRETTLLGVSGHWLKVRFAEPFSTDPVPMTLWLNSDSVSWIGATSEARKVDLQIAQPSRRPD